MATFHRPKGVPFVVSIDTEEDNWQPARSGITVRNIHALPRLQTRLEQFGVRPTYFTAYQVASHPSSAAIIRELAGSGRAEIGGHLHPWNTPPLVEPFHGRMTMLKNLPGTLQHVKLQTLTDTLEQVTGTRPAGFRTGRWGIGASTVSALAACGYRIDSSVTPFVSWQKFDDGPDHDGAPLGWYRIAPGGDVRVPHQDGSILEIPASFGYTRRPFAFWHRVHQAATAPAYRWARLGGVIDRTGIIRKVALSPETDTVANMLSLARQLLEAGVPYLHMFWHSPSLQAGLSPFVRTPRDVSRFHDAIERFIERLAAEVPLRFVTLSEAADLLTRESRPASAPIRRQTVPPGERRMNPSAAPRIRVLPSPFGIGAIPRLSVVVVSTGERTVLERHLTRILNDIGQTAFEIIVVRDGSVTESALLGHQFPRIRFLPLPGHTAEELHATGMREAIGDIVALVRAIDPPHEAPSLASPSSSVQPTLPEIVARR